MKLQISPRKHFRIPPLSVSFPYFACVTNLLRSPIRYSKKLKIGGNNWSKVLLNIVTDDSSTDLPKYASILVHAHPRLAFLSHSADLFHPLYPTAVANRRQCGIGISFRAKRRGRSSFFPPLPSIVVPRRDYIRFAQHARATRGRRGGGVHEKRKKEMDRYRNKRSRYHFATK